MTKKAALIAKLNNELNSLYMAGALCSSDYMLEYVTRQVCAVLRAKARIEAIRPSAWARFKSLFTA